MSSFKFSTKPKSKAMLSCPEETCNMTFRYKIELDRHANTYQKKKRRMGIAGEIIFERPTVLPMLPSTETSRSEIITPIQSATPRPVINLNNTIFRQEEEEIEEPEYSDEEEELEPVEGGVEFTESTVFEAEDVEATSKVTNKIVTSSFVRCHCGRPRTNCC